MIMQQDKVLICDTAVKHGSLTIVCCRSNILVHVTTHLEQPTVKLKSQHTGLERKALVAERQAKSDMLAVMNHIPVENVKLYLPGDRMLCRTVKGACEQAGHMIGVSHELLEELSTWLCRGSCWWRPLEHEFHLVCLRFCHDFEANW